ncbi:MAG TPA: DNA-formamidopyrimidine glycosylase family protein, partial [Acidimicrobiales bacterium]|nr:DNA-formamidopyrimidine glycosylase family protein [Acidimicrobiales bacterium]
MPELPEVEALVRFLSEKSAGALVERCQLASISALKTFDPPIDALEGTTVAGWQRRGKYLCMATTTSVAGGHAPGTDPGPWLVLHLARGGWVTWWDTPPRSTPKLSGRSPLALRVTLSGGRGFDATEMGTEKRLAIWVVHQPDEVEGLATLGPEPLDRSFDRTALERLLAGEKGTLKNALARQSLVAGI